MIDTKYTAAPVDGDEDEILLKAAIEEHQSSRPLVDIFDALKFRNSRDEFTGAHPYYEWQPAGFIHEINSFGVPMYLFCGWFDSFTKDGFLMYRNFKSPRKITMGGWSHSPRGRAAVQGSIRLLAVEQLRWFDYWLKGIDNGIMEEDPIAYHVMKTPKDHEWRTAQQWPLPEEVPVKYYFHEGPSGSVNSTNDGMLIPEVPEEASGMDEYTVDYTTTSGPATRWDNAVGGGFKYPDMTLNSEKGLTYTTDPLIEDVEVTGHPVIRLWVSSSATDGDFFIYLEEVDAVGISHYVTEGTVRIHRISTFRIFTVHVTIPENKLVVITKSPEVRLFLLFGKDKSSL